MKKGFLSLCVALSALTMTSCGSDNEQTRLSEAELLALLPTQAQSFVRTVLASGTIQNVTNVTDAERVTRGSAYESTVYVGQVKVEVEFDAKGVWTDIEADDNAAIPTQVLTALADFPANILTYVSTNYATVGITEVEKKAYGFKVELQNDIELLFDKEGTFLSATQGQSGTTPVVPTTTPDSIKTFVNTHFPGYAVSYVKADVEDGAAVTKYYLQKGYNQSYKLVYDAVGTLVEVEGDDDQGLAVPSSVMALFPQSIGTYITTHYAAFYVVEIQKKTAAYKVEVQHQANAELDAELVFGLDGTFLYRD